MKVFDLGSNAERAAQDRVVTVPNVLSLVRIASLPYVGWLLVSRRWTVGFLALVLFASTDWFDGYVARRFDQVSRLGQVLDPLADRLMFLVVGSAMLVTDVVPNWVVITVLIREAAVVSGALWLAARGSPQLPVSRAGKLATLGVIVGLGLFVLSAALGDGASDREPVTLVVAWVTWIVSIVVSFASLASYALTAHRGSRDEPKIGT